MFKHVIVFAILVAILVASSSFILRDKPEAPLKVSGIEIVPETPRPQPKPSPAPTILVQAEEETKPVQETNLVVKFKYKSSNPGNQ